MNRPTMSATYHLTALVSVLVLLIFNLTPALADSSQLPDKAKVVAAKLAEFEKTASQADASAKRGQVIIYLEKILTREAANANLDAALAVKELIASLSPPPPPAPAPVVKPTKPEAEGLSQKAFSIDEESTRRIEFTFSVAPSPRLKQIICAITGASDDTGDLALQYELIEPGGRIAKRGTLSSQSDTVTHKSRLSGEWKIAFIDKDTEFTGDYPGNNGTVRVSIAPGLASPKAALATASAAP